MRLYYLRHGFEYSDTYLTHHLAILAFMTSGQMKRIDGTSGADLNGSASTPAPASGLPNGFDEDNDNGHDHEDDIRSTMILAAKGLSDQGRNYYTPLALSQVLRREMSEADADALYKWINVRRDDDTDATSHGRAKHVQAQYPVGLVNLADDPEKQRLGNIIKKYADLAMDTHSASGLTTTDDEEEEEDSGESGDHRPWKKRSNEEEKRKPRAKGDDDLI